VPKDIVFEELNKKEMKLLLSAYDYDIDSEGYILSPSGHRVPSEEQPAEFLHYKRVAIVPGGSLKPIDGSPTSISKFIREEFEEGRPDEH
jgi:hypothetical protein